MFTVLRIRRRSKSHRRGREGEYCDEVYQYFIRHSSEFRIFRSNFSDISTREQDVFRARELSYILLGKLSWSGKEDLLFNLQLV